MRMAKGTSHSVALLFLRSHLGRIQASSIPNLVEDYVRFILAFFEIINISAPHIYQSALPRSPRTSITHEMYKKHASPLARIVHGMLPDSWERVVATANLGDALLDTVWSPCNRFIAVVKCESIELLDAVTLGRFCVFEIARVFSDKELCFSPDSRFLTLRMGREFISWDLQRGDRLSIITQEDLQQTIQYLSYKHSKDGKMVAVAYRFRNFSDFDGIWTTLIDTYDLLSGRRVGFRHVPEERIIDPIWTHDEYLRFATIDPKSIKIWQSSFTLEHSPVEVASFPVPDRITDAANGFLFLPSLSRLAFTHEGIIQVWDLKTPKLFLKSGLVLERRSVFDSKWHDSPCGSFSSDGRFFAYTNTAGEVCVCKESPAGYLLHQQLPFLSSPSLQPQLSPNGESIIIILTSKIHRSHTRDQDLSLEDSGCRPFTLGFSADEEFAAFGRQKESMVTIIDLKTGEPRWIIDVGVEIDCLVMAGSTVVLVGEEKIVTWNLPGGDSTFNAGINDSVRTTVLHHSLKRHELGTPTHMSISPDLSRIMVARLLTRSPGSSLEVDDVSTGLCLASSTMYLVSVMRPRFTQYGREAWGGYNSSSNKWEQYNIVEDSKSGTIELELRAYGPPSGVFQESSSGSLVTDSGWVLSPSQKPLLWLPHRWRSSDWDRTWSGRFLGLLHGELSEVVVLEFLE